MERRSGVAVFCEVPSGPWRRYHSRQMIPSRTAIAYNKSDAALSRALCSDLEASGALGKIAAQLFRAQKASDRAKCYRGYIRGVGSYRDLAYGRKEAALVALVAALDGMAIRWGWKPDAGVKFAGKDSWVLYIDLPAAGQVSFHSPKRLEGPNYPGEWHGERGRSPFRVIAFCDAVLDGQFEMGAVPHTLPLFGA